MQGTLYARKRTKKFRTLVSEVSSFMDNSVPEELTPEGRILAS